MRTAVPGQNSPDHRDKAQQNPPAAVPPVQAADRTVHVAQMYVQLVVVGCAVLWLLHRLHSVLAMPIEQLVKLLSIDIPRAHKVSVDCITDSLVYLHWDLSPEEQRSMAFHLFVNGEEVSVISGFDSHCCIKGLNPGKSYKLDLITVNPKGFKSKSRSVYIKTKTRELQERACDVLLENPESLFKLLTDKSAKDPTVHKARDKVGRSRSNTVNSLAENSMMPSGVSAIMIDPKAMEDIEDLRFYLESGQEELHEILSQQETVLQQFKEQESALIEDRQTLRERKRLEDGNRQSIKSEITMLDDARRLADLKKAKQEATLVAKRRNVESMEQELQEWNCKLELFDSEREQMEASQEEVHHELESDIQMKQEMITQLHASLTSLEETMKSMLAQKKQKETARPQLIKVFRMLREHTNSSGMIDGEGVKALQLLQALDPEFHAKIQEEIDADTKLEAKWRAEQQREVSHCHKVSQVYDVLRAENKILKSGVMPENRSVTPPTNNAVSGTNGTYPQVAMTNGQLPYQNSGNQSMSPFQNTQQAQNLQQRSVWSNNGLPLNYNNLTLDTNTGREFAEALESPSVQHFLPANLIGEELPEFAFRDSGDMERTTDSGDSINADTSMNNIQFANDINMSTRSIFHNEFGAPRYSLDSPPHSYQQEFVSPYNSPLNPATADLASLLSGGNNGSDTIHAQLANSHEHKTNMFSPRRLSNVFGFGKKALEEEAPPLPQPKRSKFFGGASGDTKPDVPMFHLSYPKAENDAKGESMTLDHLWGGNNVIHSRKVSTHSVTSLEKDDQSWSKFHGHFDGELPIPSTQSLSSSAVSDGLGPAVHLSPTHQSFATVKSSKSSLESSAQLQPTGGSPSFFRKKKNLFSFGQEAKSPVKPTGLVRTVSPPGIDLTESSVECYNPQPAKRLFSMSRKPSSVRDEVDLGSPSSSAGSSRSLVRKLSFFRNNPNGNKVAQIEEEETQ